MGFLDELKKLTQPYEDEDDYFEGANVPSSSAGYAVKPRAVGQPKVSPKAAEAEFEKSFAAAQAPAPAEEEAEDDGEETPGLFGNLGKRVSNRMNSPEKKESRERRVSFAGKESQVTLFNPKNFEEAGELLNHLEANRSVVMTLEGLDIDVGRRLLDFMSGIAFALHGKITPVSAKTYFVTPENVDLLGSEAIQSVVSGSST